MRFTLLFATAMLGIGFAQTTKKDGMHAMHAMDAKAVMATPAEMKWMPAPPPTGLPSVVQVSILSGDPFKTGMFTLRLKIPDGGKVPAHWHPTDEHITVMQGTFAAGMGDKLDPAAMKEFPAGSYVVMPKQMRHFAMAKGETVVQVTAMGPFVLNYVDPADDPRKK